MHATRAVLQISGSTRAESTNTATLRTACTLAPCEIATVLYDGVAELPAFSPDLDRDPLPPLVAELREQIAAADGVLFCSPEYAGSLTGSFKNLLDWTVGGGELYGKPVAWLNVAREPRGMRADAQLRLVLGYVGAVILEPAGLRVVVPRDAVGDDGLIVNADTCAEIERMLPAFADSIRNSTPQELPEAGSEPSTPRSMAGLGTGAMARIRDATPAQAAVLEALQRRSSDVWEEYREALAANPDAIELPQSFIDSGWVRVAVDDNDAPIGFSVVIPGDGDAHELDGLFVEPARTRCGVGRALVADAAARASGQGAQRLEVTAGPAQGFYERVGFDRVEAAQTRFGPAVRTRRELQR